ncbi:MAG: hypothetical protein KUG77_06625, partial [Nannocystaceae bacterium]|nr:hypothetical protein [Nannocystaceae bacterium]
MSSQVLCRHAVRPLFRGAALCLFLAVPGCADEGEGQDGDGMQTESDGDATQSDGARDEDSGGAEAMGDSSIRGTFVFLDGTEAE